VEAADGDVIGWIALLPRTVSNSLPIFLSRNPFTTEIVLERDASLMIINALQASGA